METRFCRVSITVAVAVFALAGVAFAATSALDNGTIKVGIDLAKGGSIYWLSASGSGTSVINTADRGRYVQQSYYSGPQPFGNSASAWPNWAWNPIAVGDFYNNASDVIAWSNNGTQIYTKIFPRQWALNNVNGGCTFEQWITLDGAAVKIHSKLNNNRAPGKKPKLFLFAGQSNMVGVSNGNTLTNEERQPLPNVKIFVANTFPTQQFTNGSVYWYWLPPSGEFVNYTPWGIYDTSNTYNLMNPVHWPQPYYGPEFTTARDIANSLGETIYIAKYAFGGSLLADGSPTWMTTKADPTTNPVDYRLSLYHSMVQWAQKALAAARLVDPNVQFGGFFWAQGESDGVNSTMANAYGTNLTTFIRKLRSDLGDPALPFIMAEPSLSASWPYRSTVIAKQEAVVAADPLANLVNTDDLPVNTNDNVHYTDASLKTLGSRMAAAWLGVNQMSTAFYSAYHQELPAVYTVGTLYKLFTYSGASPFTNAPFREIVNQGPPWEYWTATENWAAQVNSSDWGLGVYKPGNYTFLGGFAGTKGSGGPASGQTSYISPYGTEHLDYNITYEYDTTLILDYLTNIRSYVYSHQPSSTKPNYKFTSDRQRCFYISATDTGWPIQGRLRVKLNSNDPQIYCPQGFWSAASVPKIYIIMALMGTADPACALFYLPDGGSWKVKTFNAITDGQMHTYEINMASEPDYTGNITQLRFDPTNGNAAGGIAEVRCIMADPPITGSVVINGGDQYANTTSVTLSLSAASTIGTITEMSFSNDNSTWSAWEPYATSKSWTLTSGCATKTVYVRFKMI